jgi:N-methylhydantoinase A
VVEIRGRIDSHGNEIEPLDEDDLATAMDELERSGHTSVAIAFLFSYLNPAHERRAKRYVEARLGREVSVSMSHQVAPEWREYERTSSAVIDAYIGPTVARYLRELEHELRATGRRAPLRVMQSNGGIIGSSVAQARPLQTLLSGPVGGTAAGVALAEQLGRQNLICIDMGGTSFDVSLIISGKADISPEADVAGFPALMSVVNIHTIGAGGGSVAYAEVGGLRVGPRSAGADPGPAAYGRGGLIPTVTDANLLLGRMDPTGFLDGKMPLRSSLATKAVGELAQQLDMDRTSLAEGIIDVINAKMAQAIRRITVERGIVPSDFSIVAFGGAGPMHAVALAEELECFEVIVPAHAGALSAWGMLHSPFRQDFTRSFFRPLHDVTDTELTKEFHALEHEARRTFEAEGMALSESSYHRFADVRYRGQEHTLTMPVARPRGRRQEIEDEFHSAYEARYGHSSRGAPLEVVNLRVAAVVDVTKPVSGPIAAVRSEAPGFATARCVFGGTEHEATLAVRDHLRPDQTLAGPAIITEATATTVVPPGWVAAIDGLGALIVTRHGQHRSADGRRRPG